MSISLIEIFNQFFHQISFSCGLLRRRTLLLRPVPPMFSLKSWLQTTSSLLTYRNAPTRAWLWVRGTRLTILYKILWLVITKCFKFLYSYLSSRWISAINPSLLPPTGVVQQVKPIIGPRDLVLEVAMDYVISGLVSRRNIVLIHVFISDFWFWGDLRSVRKMSHNLATWNIIKT